MEKREKEDVLKMRDFRKERKPEIKIHTKEVRKKTFDKHEIRADLRKS